MENSLEVININYILSLHPRSEMYPVNLRFAMAHFIELELSKKHKDSRYTYQCEVYSFKMSLNPQSIANGGKISMLMKKVYQLMSLVMISLILPGDVYDRLIRGIGVHNITALVVTPMYAFSANNIPHMEYADRRSKSKINYKTTKLYECSKCKARETIIIEKQVRCLDEPTTAFITCMKCGNLWKN